MGDLESVAILITAIAAFRCINERFIGLQSTVGLIVVSLGVLLLGAILESLDVAESMGFEISYFIGVIEDSDFSDTLLMGILCALLFATTMQVSAADLGGERWFILGASAALLVCSTALIGIVLPWALERVDSGMSHQQALLFGAMISPTCISVALGCMKKPPQKLAILSAGESLFTAGLGTAGCMVILSADLGDGGSLGQGAGDLLKVLIRSALIGGPIGGVAYFVLKSAAKDVQTQVLVTVAVLYGCFTLADAHDASQPLATVFAGLIIGLSKETRQQVGPTWRTLDEFLHAVLLVIVGAQFTNAGSSIVLPTIVAIIVVLGSRAGAVAISNQVIGLAGRLGTPKMQAVKFLTWGGFRGGISLALAMTIGGGNEEFLFMMYGIVVFSIVAQGLTINRL